MHSLPSLGRDRKKKLRQLEKNMGLRFKKLGYLEWGLQHRSYVNETNLKELNNNEQLEFLGDSILGYFIAEHLFQQYPEYSEGKLSLIKSSLVNQEALSRLANQYDIGSYVLLGKGEEKGGGRKRDSILADVFEALVAAYYLDRGFKAVNRFLLKIFKELILEFASEGVTLDNAKNRLQKKTQSLYNVLPQYSLTSEKGPQHKKIFEVEVSVQGLVLGKGEGKTKKKGEEAAAEEALKALKNFKS